MAEPVKRVQSPISTASPNAVVIWMPRGRNHMAIAAASGRVGDLLVDLCQAPRGQSGLSDIGVIGELQRLVIRVLGAAIWSVSMAAATKLCCRPVRGPHGREGPVEGDSLWDAGKIFGGVGG